MRLQKSVITKTQIEERGYTLCGEGIDATAYVSPGKRFVYLYTSSELKMKYITEYLPISSKLIGSYRPENERELLYVIRVPYMQIGERDNQLRIRFWKRERISKEHLEPLGYLDKIADAGHPYLKRFIEDNIETLLDLGAEFDMHSANFRGGLFYDPIDFKDRW